jgi:hypothetical protein
MLVYVSMRDYFPYHNIPLVSHPLYLTPRDFFICLKLKNIPKLKRFAGYARDHWK